MRILIACILFTACAGNDDGDYPILPGSYQSPPAGGTGARINGRVCMLGDPRALGECADTGAGGLVVTLGGSTATTADNRAFVMAQPELPGALSFSVTGDNIISSSQVFAPTNTIPVLNADLFGQLLADNGITLSQGSGSIFASVLTRGGMPAQGVTAASTPSPAFGPFFDGTTPTAWTLNGTGARGVVFFPGVTLGGTNLTFTDLATSNETTVDGVQVVDGGITFVDA